MFVHGALAELPLGINPLLLGAQILNFGILYYILNRFAFPALRKTLDDRATIIRKGVEDAAQARFDLENAQKQADQVILEARQRGQQIIADATIAAQRVRAQIEEDARARAGEIAAQAQVRIQQEEAQAKNALNQYVANLAIDAASRVVGESLDGTRQRRLVEEFVAQRAGEVK